MTAAPFRLAMRVEGDWWNAYMAGTETMDGATLLASVRMTLVATPAERDAYLETIRAVFMKAAGDVLGVELGAGEVREAPEHEKAGRA